jgi:hypothetical protein
MSFGGGRINHRLQSVGGFHYLPSGLVDTFAVSRGSHFLVVAQDGIDKIRNGVVMIFVHKFIVVLGRHWHLLHLFCCGEISSQSGTGWFDYLLCGPQMDSIIGYSRRQV